MSRRRWAVAGAFGATLTLGGVLVVGQSMAAVADSGPGATDRFGHPTIAWHDCGTVADPDERAGLQAVGAQCGELAVPLDYAHPDGRRISLAVSRVRASDPAHRRGVLMLNPGGPGDRALGLVAGVKEG